MTPIERYAQVILHPGCAIPPIGEQESRKHKWSECRSQKFFLRIARKHQHKLKSSGLVIGRWVDDESLAAHLGHRLTVYYGHEQIPNLMCKDDGITVIPKLRGEVAE